MIKKLSMLLTITLLLLLLVYGCSSELEKPDTAGAVSESKKIELLRTTKIEMAHFLSGQQNNWTIESKAEIEAVSDWLNSLSLELNHYEKGKSPGDNDGGEVYMFSTDSSEFSYVINGYNDCHIVYLDEWYNVNNPSNPPFREPREINPSDNPPTTSEQSTNSVSCTENGFEMNLFTDKKVYSTTDAIQIWATLEYAGNNDTIIIWSGDPYITFSISDGKDFNSGGFVNDVLISNLLEKGEVHHFDYRKSGGWSADAPNASYWENFYKEKDLLLPAGEYTITLNGAFSLTEDVAESQSGLLCELKIKVE